MAPKKKAKKVKGKTKAKGKKQERKAPRKVSKKPSRQDVIEKVKLPEGGTALVGKGSSKDGGPKGELYELSVYDRTLKAKGLEAGHEWYTGRLDGLKGKVRKAEQAKITAELTKAGIPTHIRV